MFYVNNRIDKMMGKNRYYWLGATIFALVIGFTVLPAKAITSTVCDVTNTTTTTHYAIVQVAIDAATSGDELDFAAGQCTESINITKPLTLKGAPSYGSGIVATSGTAITISADDVTIDGFWITNPTNSTTDIIGIYSANHSNLTITNNDVSSIGQGSANTKALGVVVVSSSTDISGIIISNNSISNVVSGTHNSAAGIAVGWTSGTNTISGLVINNNQISDISSDIGAWSAGHGAYGILINHGTSGGQTIGAQVTNNQISSLEGLWAHGIGLEGDTPGAVVTGNIISDLTDYKTPSDAIGIQFEDNPSASSVTLTSNDFSNMAVDVKNTVGGTTVDARGNTWSVTNQADVNQVEAVINQDCSNSPYFHGTCNPPADGASMGVVRYMDVPAPTLLLPTDNAVVQGAVLLSDWTDVIGADHYVYESYNDVGLTSLRYTHNYSNSDKTAYSVGDSVFWWRVKAVDSIGNESPWSSSVFKVTIDNTAPAKVDGMTIWQNSTEIGCSAYVNQRTITVDWNGSTDPNFDFYRYQADDGAGPIDFTTTLVPSQRTGDIRDLDGTYMYRVQAVDKALNTGQYSDWCSVTLDREAPVTSALTSPSDTSYWNGPITISSVSTDANGVDYVNIYYRLSGGSGWTLATSVSPVDNPANDSPFSWTTNWTPPTEDTYDIKAAAVDVAGNEESSVYALGVTYDTTPPVLTLNAPTDGTTYAGTIGLNATCNETCDYVNFWWRADSQPYSNASPDKRYHYVLTNGTDFSWDLNTLAAQRWAPDTSYLMADGTYHMYAAAKDLAGNWARSAEVAVTIDNTKPIITWVSPLDGDGPLAGDVLLSAACDGTVGDCNYINFWWWGPGQTIHDAIANGQNHRIGVDGTSFSWTLDSLAPEFSNGGIGGQLDGTYTLRAAGKDLVGNYKHEQITVSFDNTAPTVNAGTDKGTVTSTFTQVGTATDVSGSGIASTIWTAISGPGAVTFGDNTSLSTTLSADTDGLYTVQLKATDTAGNENTDTFTFTWSTPTPPVTPLVLGASTFGASSQGSNDGTGGTGQHYFNVASYTEPTQTGDDATGDVKGDTINSTTDQANVAGDTNQATTQTGDNSFDILGLHWYWWVVIVTATGLVYYLYRVFKEDDDDDEEK